MKAAPLQKSNVGAAGAGGIKSKLCTTSQIRDFGSGWPPYTNCTNWNRWKISTKTSSSSFITLQITRLLECNWLICVIFFLLCLALPFYRSQKVLFWSKFFRPDQKLKCILLYGNQILVWHKMFWTGTMCKSIFGQTQKKLNQPKIFRNL